MRFLNVLSLLVNSSPKPPNNLPSDPIQIQGKRGLISRVLESALYLWLRSQVESVAHLQVSIASGDRQILSGLIPEVSLEAKRAIYQGLHLSQVKLHGHNLRINMGQILKGKPLQILEPITVDLDAHIQTDDLQASLLAPLLQKALIDALLILVGDQIIDALETEPDATAFVLQDPRIELGCDRLRLITTLIARHNDKQLPVNLQTGLILSNPSTLILQHPEWLPTPTAKRGLPLKELHNHAFELGPQVKFQTFAITPEGITARGQWIVLPIHT